MPCVGEGKTLKTVIHYSAYSAIQTLIIQILLILLELTKVIFNEFYYYLQDGCHLVICISTTCMLLVFLTLTVLILVLEVQKGCNGVVDTWIQDNFSYLNTPRPKWVWITEDGL